MTPSPQLQQERAPPCWEGKPPPPHAGGQPVRLAAAYREHQAVQEMSMPVCVRCGSKPARGKQFARWKAEPCLVEAVPAMLPSIALQEARAALGNLHYSVATRARLQASSEALGWAQQREVEAEPHPA